MDLLRKAGIWILAGAIFIATGAFYFAAVSGLQAERRQVEEEVQQRAKELAEQARKGRDTVAPSWIESARKEAELWNQQREEVRKFLASQPRRCQTRWFYDNEFADPQFRREVRVRAEWRQRYIQAQTELRQQLELPQFRGIALTFTDWGTKLPEDWEIQEAQTLFWFQKDMVDLLTYNEPNIINHILSLRGDRALPNLLAVVRNPQPEQPSATLRFVKDLRLEDDSKSPEEQKRTLADMLRDILTDPEGADLRIVMNRYSMEIEEGVRKRRVRVWDQVYELTASPAQKAFVGSLIVDDRRALADFIMDLRGVRTRADLLGLFRRHAEEEPKLNAIIDYLEDPTPAREATLAANLKEWDVALVADAIGYAVSIVDERDYNFILANHRPPVYAISWAMDKQPAVVTTPPPPGALYIPFPFTMRATMEWEKLPSLFRRLAASDWRIALQNVTVTREKEVGALTLPPLPGEVAMKPEGDAKAETATIPPQPQQVVTATLRCEARLFLPLWKELNPELAKLIPEALKAAEGERPGGRGERR